MKRAYLTITLCLLFTSICYPQSATQNEVRFDLSRIGFVMDGRTICEDKGRFQDYPSEVMDQIIAAGPKSVPVLIGMLTDTRMVKTQEPIICFWPGMTISDVAFCALGDLFLDPQTNTTTIPGAGWNEMLGPDEGRPAWEQLHRFTRTQGLKALQAKWQKLWDNHASQVYWDPKARCFRLKASS